MRDIAVLKFKLNLREKTCPVLKYGLILSYERVSIKVDYQTKEQYKEKEKE